MRNVPALGCGDELLKLFATYGDVEESVLSLSLSRTLALSAKRNSIDPSLHKDRIDNSDCGRLGFFLLGQAIQ